MEKNALTVFSLFCVIAFTGCTQTQVVDNAKGAGGVLAETIITAALDVAFGTNSATDNLSDEERAACGSNGSCLAVAHRKRQTTEARIERAGHDHARLVGPAESSLSSSLAKWIETEQDVNTSTGDTQSVMVERRPYKITDEMMEKLPSLTIR